MALTAAHHTTVPPQPPENSAPEVVEAGVRPLPPVLEHPAPPPASVLVGVVLAVVSAIAFGTSGPFAKALLESGWSPAGAVLVRLTGGALGLGIPTLILLRGDLRPFGTSWKVVCGYGVVGVAFSQLSYFMAVSHLSVGVAMLLEYLAPVLVVGYRWARVREVPSVGVLLGSALSVCGLCLVIDVAGGITIDPVGLCWGFWAACCNAAYFVLGARPTKGLPAIGLAAGGLAVGAAVIGLAGLAGAAPVVTATRDVTLAGNPLPWWLPAAGLALISAAVAYGFGVAGSRRLGSTVASFVGLNEVLATILFAWLLLGEVPGPMQLLGGATILAGVLAVKLGGAHA
ncbi:EamA family transporter [Arsenicicoccus dermatophilus]|uniref:EamA family transporter n=1 Tax=Arsenicicoccus dermatophilus TaxID=1076331 RepID=UPI003916DE09